MRLRSSQFVFLMLLICSVQVRQKYAWHRAEDAVSTRPATAAQNRQTVARSAERINRLCLTMERLTPCMSLDSGSLEMHRTVWTMPSPARESAAIVSFTSFLRG